MEFSLLNAVRNHPQSAYAEKDVYADYISDALLAEEMGFVRSWYGEHHFRECQWTGSPIQVCTAVAARTERLRVGTAVALLPFHDPIRMAEDVAICDILSGGRFDFGVGPGSQFEEFRTFGIDPKTMNGRMYESIDWILEAFASKDEFSHKGKYYDIPDMTFTTKPVQDPVPVWSSSMGPRNAARSAERGFNFIGPGNFGYDAALDCRGSEPGRLQDRVDAGHPRLRLDRQGVGGGRRGHRVLRELLQPSARPRRPASGQRPDHAGDDPRRQRRVLVGGSRHSRRRDQGARALRLRPARPHHRARLRVPPRRHAQRRRAPLDAPVPRARACLRSPEIASAERPLASQISIDRAFATTEPLTTFGFVAKASARSGDAM